MHRSPALVFVAALAACAPASPPPNDLPADPARGGQGLLATPPASPTQGLLRAAWSVSGSLPLTELGASVAGAGDTNGDGYDDLLVGAPNFSGIAVDFEGSASVYYGSASGPATVASWTQASGQESSEYGSSVAWGDVNGDGFHDVVVGAPLIDKGQKDEGRVFVYYGSAAGLPAAVNFSVESDQVGANFGASVAAAGDVNGDGYDDLVVGAPRYDDGAALDAGSVSLYYGSAIGLTFLDVWSAAHTTNFDSFGTSVSSAGDVNADGYDDVIVGAPGVDVAAFSEGAAYLYLGSSTGLATTPAWTVSSPQGAAQLGGLVAAAGDVDGDGYDDVLVGAIGYDGVVMEAGQVQLYRGTADGLETTAAWAAEGDASSLLFGKGASSAGDVNDDGYADVVIGAPLAERGESDEGTVALYLGSAAGLEPGPSLVVESDVMLAQLGSATAPAGDVDGDGTSDVVVGAPSAGSAHVWLGGCAGASPDTDGDGVEDDCDACPGEDDRLYDLDHDASCALGGADCDDGDWSAYPGAVERCDGADNACAGAVPPGELDLDGDGRTECAGDLDDLAPILDLAWTEPVGAYDAKLAASAGDVDGDGYDDVVVRGVTAIGAASVSVYLGGADGPEGLAAWTVADALTDLGRSVASAGDVDGDGFDDLVVGAPLYDGGSTDEGVAYLYRGSAAGLETTAAWSFEPNQTSANFGWSVAGAGDVNADGFDDVLVGAYLFDGGQVDEGRAYLFLGSATGLGATPAWTAEPNTTSSSFGYAVAGAGDLDGDGFADVAVGAPDYGGFFDAGRVYLYYGSATGLTTGTPKFLEPELEIGDYGISVSGAGDVNGDGFDDLLIGSPVESNPSPQEGRAYVYAGDADGIDPDPMWIGEPDQDGASFGQVVSGAGDVNADGYGDVIIGAPSFDAGERDEGRAFVYLGSPYGLGTAAWAQESDAVGQRFPDSVALAGDVNGDGYDDVLVTGAVATVYAGGCPGHGEDADGDGVEDACDVCPTGDDREFDVDRDGFCAGGADAPLDCDDADATVFPGAVERCDGVDDACAGAVPADEVDNDGDGFLACADCDDADVDVFPGAVETCNGVDDACSGAIPADELDGDGDGFLACEECDDADALVYPGAPERCDGEDDACSGVLPLDELDVDRDGVRVCAGDCDDADATTYPGAAERCDGRANTCDGGVPPDEVDDDLDGFLACDECDDADRAIYPGAPERCDGRDDSCAGALAPDELDVDGDGYLACAECDDQDPDTYPGAPERCDGRDNTCAGAISPGEVDADGDGFLSCAECDDSDASVFPGAPELCNGRDDACAGSLPDDEVDGDGDGILACAQCEDCGAPEAEEPGCGCGHAPQGGAAWAFGAVLWAALGRRGRSGALATAASRIG